jgi:hypothetical protein
VYRWKRTHISVRFLILFFWAVRSFFFLSLSLSYTFISFGFGFFSSLSFLGCLHLYIGPSKRGKEYIKNKKKKKKKIRKRKPFIWDAKHISQSAGSSLASI